MPRPRNIIPSDRINLTLPAPLKARIDELLWSEVEGRVPYGEHTRFFSELARERFDSESLDLSPFTGDLPGILVVRGSPFSIARLRALLESHQ